MTAPLALGLTVLEGISGIVLMGASLPSSGSLETASRISIVTAVLVGISSTVHLMNVRKRSRNREASEGKRLYAAIQYETSHGPTGLDDGTSKPGAFTDVEDGSGSPGDSRS